MPFSELVKTTVKRLAGMRCCWCRRLLPLEVHHITPQADGGSDSKDNAAPLCPNCHTIYGGNPTLAKEIRIRRDYLFTLVAEGTPIVNMEPHTSIEEYELKGILIHGRPRQTTTTWYEKWKADIDNWFEEVADCIRSIYGISVADEFIRNRQKHKFRQHDGRPYGYDEWKEVIRDDLQFIAQIGARQNDLC